MDGRQHRDVFQGFAAENHAIIWKARSSSRPYNAEAAETAPQAYIKMTLPDLPAGVRLDRRAKAAPAHLLHAPERFAAVCFGNITGKELTADWLGLVMPILAIVLLANYGGALVAAAVEFAKIKTRLDTAVSKLLSVTLGPEVCVPSERARRKQQLFAPIEQAIAELRERGHHSAQQQASELLREFDATFERAIELAAKRIHSREETTRDESSPRTARLFGINASINFKMELLRRIQGAHRTIDAMKPNYSIPLCGLGGALARRSRRVLYTGQQRKRSAEMRAPELEKRPVQPSS